MLNHKAKRIFQLFTPVNLPAFVLQPQQHISAAYYDFNVLVNCDWSVSTTSQRDPLSGPSLGGKSLMLSIHKEVIPANTERIFVSNRIPVAVI